MKIFSRIMNCIATVITILAICAAGVLFVPRIFGYVPYIVLSGSMEPSIGTGSVVFINTNDTDVAVGDVIAFKATNDVMVTHRIASIDSATGTYTTKGDANDKADVNPVKQSQIVGTYKTHIPELGYVLAKFEEKELTIGDKTYPAGPLLIIMILVVVNGLSMFISAMAESDDDAEDDDYWDEDSDSMEEYDEDEEPSYDYEEDEDEYDSEETDEEYLYD